jgi:hypothetical protein
MTPPEDEAGGASSSRIICTFRGILLGVCKLPSMRSVSMRSTTLAAASAGAGGGGGGDATRNESNLLPWVEFPCTSTERSAGPLRRSIEEQSTIRSPQGAAATLQAACFQQNVRKQRLPRCLSGRRRHLRCTPNSDLLSNVWLSDFGCSAYGDPCLRGFRNSRR